jgi:hypothetical protein
MFCGPHRAGVGLLLPDRIGRGASGHRARHRLAGRATPGCRLLRPCGRSLQADGRAHWCGRRPAGRGPHARASRMRPQAPPPRPAGASLAGAAAVGGPCRRRRPALATWICEPAGLLALTTLTGYASRVRRCWPKCPAGGGRGGRPWPRNNDGRLSITHDRGTGGIRRRAAYTGLGAVLPRCRTEVSAGPERTPRQCHQWQDEPD